MPPTIPSPGVSPAPARTARHRRATRAGALLVLLLPTVLAAACSDDDDEDDLTSFCAVARDRDMDRILLDRIEGPPAPIESPEGTFSSDFLDSATASFGDILAEDSPDELRADAERYRDALAAAIEGDPPTGAELDEALAAGGRIEDWVVVGCTDPPG